MLGHMTGGCSNGSARWGGATVDTWRSQLAQIESDGKRLLGGECRAQLTVGIAYSMLQGRARFMAGARILVETAAPMRSQPETRRSCCRTARHFQGWTALTPTRMSTLVDIPKMEVAFDVRKRTSPCNTDVVPEGL